ncbi:MAG: hypothetical protein LLG04_08130 [Parachlamydia sp.]|nr:hypothetical protein [Parachlamydia sp.]
MADVRQKLENRGKFTPKESAEQIKSIRQVIRTNLAINQSIHGEFKNALSVQEHSLIISKIGPLTEKVMQLYFKADQEMERISAATGIPHKKIADWYSADDELYPLVEAGAEEVQDFEQHAASFETLFARFQETLHLTGKQTPQEKLAAIATHLKLSKYEIRQSIRLGNWEQLIQEQQEVLRKHAPLIKQFETVQKEGKLDPTALGDRKREFVNLKHLTYALRTAAKVERVADGALAVYEKKKKRHFRASKVEIRLQSTGSQLHVATSYGQKKLGEGGAGRVERGVDLATGEPHAYKSPTSSEGNKELQNEFDKLTFLHRNGVVPGIQLPPFRLLHYADGKFGVEHRLYDGDFNRLPENKAIKAHAALQLLQGLHILASQGLLHKDIKLSNIFVKKQAEGRFLVHLADFGGVRFLHEIDMNKEIKNWDIGRTDRCFGDGDEDRAKEALEAGDTERLHAILQKSSIYALGLCLRFIFKGDGKDEDLNAYPKELVDLLNQMTHPDVEKRPMPQETLERFLGVLPKIV